jgi:hypothetical protein
VSTSLLIESLDAVALAVPRIMELATQEERAAVVSWLRDLAMDSCEWSERAVVYDSCAFAIEHGEHRREEKE